MPDRHPLIFRRAMEGTNEPADDAIEAASAEMSSSTGQAMPTPLRGAMERAFGVDLAPVRLHTGAVARRATGFVAARALAHGTDVYLPDGIDASPSAANLGLLAHELTHVVQHQTGRPTVANLGTTPGLRLARRASGEEQEADRVERLVTAALHGQPTASAIPPPALTLARGHSATSDPRSSDQISRLPSLGGLPNVGGLPGALANSGAPRALATALPTVTDAVTTATGAVTSATGAITSAAGAVATAAEGIAGGGGDAAEMAERVYALLEQRLLVERERAGSAR